MTYTPQDESSQVLAGRNLIVNGDMLVSQAIIPNTYAASRVDAVGSGACLADQWDYQYQVAGAASMNEYRWNTSSGDGLGPAYGSNETVGHSGNEFPALLLLQPGVKATLGINDYFSITQVIESRAWSAVRNGSVDALPLCLSFVAYCNTTTNIVVQLQAGAVGASGRKISRLVTIVGGLYQRYWVTFPADPGGPVSGNNSGPGQASQNGLQLRFWLASGTTWAGGALNTSWATAPAANTNASGCSNLMAASGAAFHLTGVQLEVGVYPTPFEHRTYNEQLVACRRYYQRYWDPPLRGVVNSAGTGCGRMAMVLPVQMRAVPTSQVAGTLNFHDGNTTAVFTGTFPLSTYNSAESGEFDFTFTSGTLGVNKPCGVYRSGDSGSVDFNARLPYNTPS